MRKKRQFRASLLVASFLTISAIVISQAIDAEGRTGYFAGPGSTGVMGCQSGNCSNPQRTGAFWVTVEMNGAERTVEQILNGKGSTGISYDLNKRKKVNGVVKEDPTYIAACEDHAYLLISPLSKTGWSAPVDIDTIVDKDGKPQPDSKGMLDLDDANSWINYERKIYNPKTRKNDIVTKPYRLPNDVKPVDEDTAKKAFKSGKKDYKRLGYVYHGRHLGWFCGPGPTTSTPPSYTTGSEPSDSTPEPVFVTECHADNTREWGDTRSRIAVRNETLDGKSWTAKDGRQGLPTDSGWTDNESKTFTIAKPGDGIKFKHEFCAGDRFVRRTAHSDYVGYDEPHDQIFNITPNTFQIGANKEKYTFGNGIDWVNKKGKSITAYEDLFAGPGKPNGVSLTYNGYGISVDSPTSDNKDYKCAKYEEDNPYIKGTYQIPGFDTGKCKSSEKTEESNPVGHTIEQWHDFNRVRVWEAYSHDRAGGCGCNLNDARLIKSYEREGYGPKIGHYLGYRTAWSCNNPTKTSCNWECYESDVYGRCLRGDYKDYFYSLTKESMKVKYETRQEDLGIARKRASVYVPYNYSTLTSSSMSDNGVLFQGANAEYKFTWKVEPRENDKLSDFEYATVTPPNTEVKMVEFLYHPDNKKVEGNKFTKDDPATFFKKKGAIVTNSKTIKTGNQNPNGLYDGKKTSKKMTSVVPDNDEWVGYKYCVAVGIFPSDSHDDVNGPGSNNSLEMQYTYGKGAMDAGSYWNVSGATCRTISKKPSLQVWNGSIYTNGAVNTYVSQKIVNAKLGSDINAQKDLFGSWTDYALIVGKDINGMVSGATLGFNNSRYDLSGNGGQPDSSDIDKKLNPLTIANQNTFGNSGINASTAINMNLERLRSRYSEKASNLANNETNTGSQSAIVSSKTGMQFVYHNGNLKTSLLAIRHSGAAPNQTTYRDRNGNLIKGLGDGKNDNTLVIYIKGNLIIDNNICLGDGCKGTGMQLIDYGLNRKTNSAAKLPQVLIFADNISIAENVTRVDAWLIAQDGEINTCAEHTPNSVVAKDARQRFADGNCDKTLMINGPIYAYDLVLPRTAGATHGYSPSNPSDVLYRQFGAVGNANDANLGSATPAEIFNLRADVYLWAYNQAQRYSEAIVTYKRELAPRY